MQVRAGTDNMVRAPAMTEEDMEAWRQKRHRGEDPVAQPGAAGGTEGYDYV